MGDTTQHNGDHTGQGATATPPQHSCLTDTPRHGCKQAQVRMVDLHTYTHNTCQPRRPILLNDGNFDQLAIQQTFKEIIIQCSSNPLFQCVQISEVSQPSAAESECDSISIAQWRLLSKCSPRHTVALWAVFPVGVCSQRRARTLELGERRQDQLWFRFRECTRRRSFLFLNSQT